MENRIKTVENKSSKKVWQELKTSIRPTVSFNLLLQNLGIKENTEIKSIPEEKLEELRLTIKNKEISGTIFGKKKHQKEKEQNIQNLIKINATRGRRLKSGYPAKGQRTRTNAKTAKKEKI